jgi:hypothetical protein
MVLDVRHFATMLELDFQVIKNAIVGVNSNILLDAKEQATLIFDNYNTLGRQPTAHSNKISFFSFPVLTSEYKLLIER